MALELYHAAYSTCSQKVRLTLAEKNLDYVSHEINFRKEEQLTPKYLKINPNGVVPTLVHDQEVIVDSSCIMEYLDETFSEPALGPRDPLGRAKMRAWLRFIEEVPTVAVRTPSFEQIFLPTLRLIQGKKSFDKSVEKRTIRKGFYGKMGRGKGFEQSEIDNSHSQLLETAKRMEQALATSPWLMGENISLVDLCLAPLLDRIQDLELDYLWLEYPQVRDWITRIQQRPSFKTSFYKGSRLSQRFEYKIAMMQARKENRLQARALKPV